MHRTALRILAIGLALLTLTAACSSEASDDPLGVEGDEEFEGDVGEIDVIRPATGLGSDDAPTSDEVVAAAVLDVDAFWAREFEDLYGVEYVSPEGGYCPTARTPSSPRAANRRPRTATSPATRSSARATTSSRGTT